MKNNIVKSLFLVLCSASLLLASCNHAGEKVKPVEPDVPGGEMENPEDILDDFDFKPTNPADYSDKAYYYSDHINDVEPTFRLMVSPNPDLLTAEQTAALTTFAHNLKAGISIADTKGNEIELMVQQHEDEFVSLSPTGNSAYEPGVVYTATMLNASVVFKDKDPNIRTLYFDIKRENAFTYNVADDLKYFNVNKVVTFAPDEYVELDPASEEAKEWFNNHTYEMVYASDEFSKLKEGDNFAICPFKNGKPEMDDKNSFYGKFVSSSKANNGYKVTYKNANLAEIFQSKDGKLGLDVNANEQEISEFRDVRTTFDKEAFKQYIVNDPQYRRLAHAASIVAGNDVNAPTKYDVLTHATISPSFAWNAPKFVFQVVVGGTIPINDDKTAAIKIEFTYQYISVMSAGGSVEVETFLGVPYWIEAKSEMSQTITHKFSFKIALMRNFKPEEQDTSDMKKMIKEAYDKLENDPAYFMDRTEDKAATSGNEKFFPIAELNFPFGGIFSLYISLDLHLTLDLRVILEYNYVNEHTQRVLNFSTSDGVKNTTNTDTVSCDCHTIDLLGGIGVQLGFLVRAGLCITGLSKIFGMGFSVEAGIYADFKGMVGVTWGSDLDARFVGGIDLDVGIYGQMSAFIDFLIFHPKYDFVKGKLSFFGFKKAFSIIGLFGPDEINITQPVTDISSLGLLTAKTFDVSNMSVDIQSFKLSDEVNIEQDKKSKKVHPLTMTSDSPYLVVNEATDTLMLAQYVPASFTAHLTIKVDQSFTYLLDGDDPLTKVVTVHYNSLNAKEVSIKGVTDTFKVDKGKTFTLPTLHSDTTLGDKYNAKLKFDDHFNLISDGNFNYDDTYYDFAGFSDGEHTYNPGDIITVGDKNITIVPILKVIIYHTATFYNGKGQVISVSRVREYTDAVAPSMEQIMQGMDGYIFYGWDRDFKNLSEDINVYGIYYKGE